MISIKLFILFTIFLVPIIILVEHKTLQMILLICLFCCMSLVTYIFLDNNFQNEKYRKIINNNNQQVCINNQYGIVDVESCYKKLPKCTNAYNQSVILAYNTDKYTGEYNIVSFYPLSNSTCNQDNTNTVINRIKSVNQDFTIIYNK